MKDKNNTELKESTNPKLNTFHNHDTQNKRKKQGRILKNKQE